VRGCQPRQPRRAGPPPPSFPPPSPGPIPPGIGTSRRSPESGVSYPGSARRDPLTRDQPRAGVRRQVAGALADRAAALRLRPLTARQAACPAPPLCPSPLPHPSGSGPLWTWQAKNCTTPPPSLTPAPLHKHRGGRGVRDRHRSQPGCLRKGGVCVRFMVYIYVCVYIYMYMFREFKLLWSVEI